ncbi:MAG: response regulator transcription factor [Melioribacteraceae bacterium]|nr:response regulator transcription factor [Melioribacteraceae bacterium]
MEKKKILLVEDDINLGTILSEFLLLKNFEIDLSKNGEEGIEKFKNGDYDLCLLDVMMPKKDGFTLAKEIRQFNKHIPIIFLTAKSLQNDKIEGLKIGADDYITKPFNTEELLLRINAILKRYNSENSFTKSLIYKIGKYTFDYKKRELKIKRSVQTLTFKEAELLKLLCENKNNVLRRDLALTKIWNDENYFTSRSMDVYITKLRNHLKNDRGIIIENIHGVGFKLLVQ